MPETLPSYFIGHGNPMNAIGTNGYTEGWARAGRETPRPNYWAALLWRRLMGTTVLDSGVPIQQGLHVYAHSLRNTPGGVALLVINNDRDAPRTLRIPTEARRYTLSAGPPQNTRLQLNGTELQLGADHESPDLTGVPVADGDISFEPATITFLAFPGAGSKAAR